MPPASMPKSKASLVPTRRSNKPKAPSHPSYMDMIHKCIAEAGDKDGVSRQRLKAFITKRFGLEVEGDKRMSGALTRCIHHGVDIGELVQPKGPAGKIKLSPKAKARFRKKDRAADKSKSEGAKKSSKDERKPKKKATSSTSTRIVSSDEDDDDDDASSDGNESDVSSDGDEESSLPVKGEAKAKVIPASKVKPSAKARKVKTSKKASGSSSTKKAPKKTSSSSSSSRKR